MVLAIAMLAGLMVPFANAAPVTIEFYNPLAEQEPIDNIPIASRAPLRNKVANGDPINILALYYGGKAWGSEAAIALADLVRDEFIIMNPDLAGKVTITVGIGGTSNSANVPAYPTSILDNPIGSDNNAVSYWKNQGPIGENGYPVGRAPFLGNPWGPKGTGYMFTGFPSYELNFERYAHWASYDAVIFSNAD